MSIYKKIAEAQNDDEVLEIVADFLEDNSGRLAASIRQTSAEAADGVCAYLRKKRSAKRQRHAEKVKDGRTDAETTFNEIQYASYHYWAKFTGEDGFSEYGFLVTLLLIVDDFLDCSKGRTLEDLKAVKFALAARCRFLYKQCENMAEGFEHFRNETAGKKDKQN